MKAELIDLLAIIQKGQPSIYFPELKNKAQNRDVLIDHENDITENAYCKKTERALNKILSITYMNIPLDKIDGRPVHYTLPPGYTLPASDVDITLAMTLHLSEQVLSNVLPNVQKQQLNDYLTRAEDVLNEKRNNSKFKRFIESVTWHPEDYENKILLSSKHILDNPYLSSIDDAIFNQRMMIIEYQNRYYNDTVSMTVSPLGLVVRGNILYLVITYKFQDEFNFRHLNVDRINGIDTLDSPAIKPDNFNLSNYLKDGAFNKNGDKKPDK
jgi:predicted DNA-binding transcriptional regulator YafY